MGELMMELPMRAGASHRKPTSPNIKIEQQDSPLHTVNEKLPTMDAVSQPVEAQYLPDAIEIFKLESGGVRANAFRLTDTGTDDEVEVEHQKGDSGH
jgi:hypothetical protein